MVGDPLPSVSGVRLVETIDRRVIQLFALVCDAVAGATDALLAADREAAQALIERDLAIDAQYDAVSREVREQLVAGTDSPLRRRYLVAVSRVLPELERSADLAEHIAQRAARGLSAAMTARARGLVGQMGEVACAMWQMATDAYGVATPEDATRLDALDDEMDDLHARLTEELLAGQMPLGTTVELVLVARFYERLGDHAVNVTRSAPRRVRAIGAAQHAR